MCSLCSALLRGGRFTWMAVATCAREHPLAQAFQMSKNYSSVLIGTECNSHSGELSADGMAHASLRPPAMTCFAE